MNILVLGASGNTGSQVVTQLLEKGVTPKVLLRDESKATALGLSAADAVLGDFSDRESLVAALRGIDRIYVALPAHPDAYEWAENVVHAAKVNGVKRIVKLSGFDANEQAKSDIIRTHAKTDALIKASGVQYTLLQPHSFFQNIYGSLATIKDHGKFYLPLGNAAQAIIDVRDIAGVAVAALTEAGHANQVYRLSGPAALDFHQVASLISAASGKTIEYVPVPKEACNQALLEMGLSPWLAGSLAEILDWFAQGGYTEVTTTVEQVLGKPARSYSDFAKEFAVAINH